MWRNNVNDNTSSKVSMQGKELSNSRKSEIKWKWQSAAIFILIVCGATLFWLLSNGVISQGVALWTIPFCFVTIAALITYIAIMNRQK